MGTIDDAGLSERLEQVYTGVIYDVMRERGLGVSVLPPTIRPLHGGNRLAGPIFTVSGRIDPTMDSHQTMLEWTRFLQEVPEGRVVVCQPNDSTIAHMGELSAETLQLRGIRGYIVDGGCRDLDFIEKIGFPVWCRYATPADIKGRWVAEDLGSAITIGDATVRTDDYVLADSDGIVVIPAEQVQEVLAAAEEAMGQEDLVRAAIREGVPPQDAYLTYKKF